MKTRLVAVIVAVLLGVVGTVVLVGYVRGADARALAGTQTVNVLMVAAPIAAGTPGEALADLIETKAVPAMAAVAGRIIDLDQLAGQLSVVALVAGEQLLPSQFAAPDPGAAAVVVPIPKGFQQVTVVLQSQRALGGDLKAGDHVGVFLSFAPDVMIYSTHLQLSSVLVTAVRLAHGGDDPTAPAATETGAATTPAVPADVDPGPDVYVTFAVNAADAEELVFGAEHGTIWLSNEPLGSNEDGVRVVQPSGVYDNPPTGATS